MPRVVYILLGAAFTAAVCMALGKLLLRGLRLEFYRQEEHWLALVCGAPLLSLLVFLLCTVGLARKGIFLGVGVAILAVAWRRGVHRPAGEAFAPLGRFWRWGFGIVFAVYTVVYLFNAMAPEVSPDGVGYHLDLVSRYVRHHGFYRITDDMYAYLSQGVEMLYLFAFAFGRHSAAALVHAVFLAAMPLLVLSYARRCGMPAAGVCGGLLVYASPVIGVDGTSAYIDVAVAAIVFTVFYLLQVWDVQRRTALLIPIGLVAGFAYAAKYTAALVIPYALLFIAWKSWRKGQNVVRPALLVGVCALALMLPWMVKNWIWVGNPFAPFLNGVFPNPYVSVGLENAWRAALRPEGFESYRDLFMAVTVDGRRAGIVGPLFLLAPVALLALGSAPGRQLLLAAATMGITCIASTETRFLIPVLPFLSLAMAMTFLRVKGLAPALVLAHAVLSWPSVIPRYSAAWTWRLPGIPIREGLRITPEERVLGASLSNYEITRKAEQVVPAGARVLGFKGLARSYTTRDFAVAFQSTPGTALGRILETPLSYGSAPTWLLRFSFAGRSLRRLRVLQTAPDHPGYWSVSELRVFNEGRELVRAPEWRLRAWPNPWRVQDAFDNSPVTVWSSEESVHPGMFLEVDFGKPALADAVLIECPHDQPAIRLKLEGQGEAGNWTTLASAPEAHEAPPIAGLRRAAAVELKRRGIEYFVIYDNDFGAADFRSRMDEWGIQVAEKAGGARLYRIL